MGMMLWLFSTAAIYTGGALINLELERSKLRNSQR